MSRRRSGRARCRHPSRSGAWTPGASPGSGDSSLRCDGLAHRGVRGGDDAIGAGTASEPAGSAKSFCRSTTISAVDGSKRGRASTGLRSGRSGEGADRRAWPGCRGSASRRTAARARHNSWGAAPPRRHPRPPREGRRPLLFGSLVADGRVPTSPKASRASSSSRDPGSSPRRHRRRQTRLPAANHLHLVRAGLGRGCLARVAGFLGSGAAPSPAPTAARRPSVLADRPRALRQRRGLVGLGVAGRLLDHRRVSLGVEVDAGYLVAGRAVTHASSVGLDLGGSIAASCSIGIERPPRSTVGLGRAPGLDPPDPSLGLRPPASRASATTSASKSSAIAPVSGCWIREPAPRRRPSPRPRLPTRPGWRARRGPPTPGRRLAASKAAGSSADGGGSAATGSGSAVKLQLCRCVSSMSSVGAGSTTATAPATSRGDRLLLGDGHGLGGQHVTRQGAVGILVGGFGWAAAPASVPPGRSAGLGSSARARASAKLSVARRAPRRRRRCASSTSCSTAAQVRRRRGPAAAASATGRMERPSAGGGRSGPRAGRPVSGATRPRHATRRGPAAPVRSARSGFGTR